MSYKALYRKYRPKSFQEVKGQEHIITTLSNIIYSREISHAYLFSGPKGVGKTSVAKIFANLINCYHNIENLTSLCKDCALKSETNIDVIEMDAASNNGVDAIRDLRDKIQNLPTSGNYKVYIIDEVHMLSKGAFNALLKTLEEPPAHVVFILATTDPQKIPATILSRLQRFNFRKITPNVLVEQLKEVLDAEKISYDSETLKYIARLATGGMRDALSIADQARAYGNGQILLENVMYSFGITSNESLISIINKLYTGDIKDALEKFASLKDAGIDYNQFKNGLIDIIKDYLIYSKTLDDKNLEILNIDEFKTLIIDINFALNAFEMLYKLEKDLFYTENPFQLIELYLIKISQLAIKSDLNNSKPITKEPDMNDKDKKIITTDEKLSAILEETQELILSTTNSTVKNELIEDDILTGTFDLPEDSLIDTREIDLSESASNEADTPKIQLIEPFDQKYKQMPSFKSNYSVNEVEQILLKTDRNIFSSNQASLKIIESTVDSYEYKDLIFALSECSMKAAGSNFIVLTSSNIPVLNYLQAISNKQNVQNFIRDYFGSYKHLVLLEKMEYKTIAKTLMNKIQTNTQSIDANFSLGSVKIEKELSPNEQLFNLLNTIK
ncbi:DNA polymerase III subunit gamma/tau [Mycoplasmopsis felifaucium]|uniref:DNA polymerase III subunit gamma/tau n=1 Tax=Mycoplasmopsis felifaucium TaxID=35768 RepID=A0ABZ2RPP8_9BACT